jgi:hypothetical protein
MGVLLDLAAPMVWTVPDVLTLDECRVLIARIEALGCTPAPITTGAGFVMRPDIRNNTRVVLVDLAIAAFLFQLVGPEVPPVLPGCYVFSGN